MANYRIYLPGAIDRPPSAPELSAATILADYFKRDVHFEARHGNLKTADFRIGGALWELKSPLGRGKRTIQNNIRKANQQCANIVVDLRFCKINEEQAIQRVRHEVLRMTSIKKVLVITKGIRVLAIK